MCSMSFDSVLDVGEAALAREAVLAADLITAFRSGHCRSHQNAFRREVDVVGLPVSSVAARDEVLNERMRVKYL